MRAQRKHSITSPCDALAAWRAQVSEGARDPSLRGRLLTRESELLPRFAAHYEKLTALPRRTRRALQRRWKRPLAGVALLMALGPVPAFAAIINVGGGCTLVDAITSAETDTATGGCTDGTGADTLVLPPGSTHTLTQINNGINGLPLITSNITIQGNGSTIRRIGGPNPPLFRIFEVAFGGTLRLQQTTVSGGRAGASFGGAVANRGTFVLTGSTISGNTAAAGGGITNYGGTATVATSTISGNTTTIGYGGGVLNYVNGTMTMTNCTISDNSAFNRGGGVINYDTSNLTVTHCTITGNAAGTQGGGVWNTASLTLDSTLISGNTAPTAREIFLTTGTIAANNFNLFGSNGNSGVTGFQPGPNDIVPAVGVTVPDILDQTLADNAPGTTQTHALIAGSPALDAVTTGCPPPAVDQRAVTRPQGTACDIGSFELEGTPPPTTPPTGGTPPSPDGTCFGLVATITGTELDDTLSGTPGPDVINGLGGDDEISGKRGNDRVCGGVGNDTLGGGRGADRLDGGEDTDECIGGIGPDTAVNCEAVTTVP